MKIKNILLILLALSSAGCERLGLGPDLKFSGTVEVTEHSLSFPVPARISEINRLEGERVQKGETLAFTDRFEQASKDYNRLLSLWKSGGIDSQSVEHAKIAMEDQRIQSPVNGEILVKARQSGETVSAGSPVLVVGEIESPWIKIYVPEEKIQKIAKGQRALIRLDGAKSNLEGKIFYISPKAEFTPRNVQTKEERVTQTFLVKIRFLENQNNIHPGVFGDVIVKEK